MKKITSIYACHHRHDNRPRVHSTATCYKAYPRLGNRSICYPGSSVGSTFTFGVDGRTRVRIPLRTFLLEEMLARASYYQHVSLGPQDLDRSLGRHVRPYTETRQPIRPKDPAVPRVGECYKAYSGLGNGSIFYSGSSVGSTITPFCKTHTILLSL